ncbi:MAG: NAD(P)/FAD-dependent oxidoreductase [Actinomycetota bacterium]
MPRYDAVVVGAGPAGSATAAHLARSGSRVLLCDRLEFPRDKACGGGLTPRGVAALDDLGIKLTDAQAIRVGGIEMGFGSRGAINAAFPSTAKWPDYGLVARRSVMDQAVLDAAVDAGAELRTVRVAGPLFTDGTCTGVRIKTNGTVEEVEASWTIAADGATSTTARAAGLSDDVASGRGFWYAAMRSYFGPVAPITKDGEAQLEFYPLNTKDGRWLPAYGWIFPLPDGSANVGVDLPHSPSLDACLPLREAFDAFVADLRRVRPGFEDSEMLEPPHGALLPEAMRGFRPGVPGMLAVGDAAGLITPYSGEGIAYALESGELAAKAIGSDARPSEVVRRYAKDLEDGYGFHFSAALRFMKAMRKAPLANAAVAVGSRSPRVFRAAVRIMAFLIEDDPDTTSTVSKGYSMAKRLRGIRRSGS